MTGEAAIKDAIRKWVATHAKAPCPEILDSTRLIEERLITSLQILDLVLFLEELRCAPLDASRLKPGAFADISEIYKTFFEDRA